MTSSEDFTRANRILGCLLGGAIGDALGAPVEFWTASRIAQECPDGVRTYLPTHYGSRLGLITDDTQMTLFTLEGLLRARHTERDPIVEVHHSYLQWLQAQLAHSPPPDAEAGSLASERWLYSRRAPGNTCMSALAQTSADQHLGEPASNDSKGCGAVMRSAPFALVDIANAPDLAVRAAALTHGHPSGQVSSGALVVMLRALLAGDDLNASIAQAITWCTTAPGGDETHAALVAAVRATTSDEAPGQRNVEQLGGGWVGEEALAIAVYCALSYPRRDQIIDAFSLAVAHGGDSDSTGAICGHLLGVLHGADALPSHLVTTVEGRDAITRLVADITSTVDSQ